MTDIKNENIALDSGTYEIIQNRLREQAQQLRQRLSQLNQARREVFTSLSMELIANQRITTENNGVARGILALNDSCIFAYNVHFGLRSDIKLSDVFSIYKFKDNSFEAQPLSIIEDENFITDFTNLYKYYRDSIFAKFRRTEHYIYMIFQTSANPEDRKAFKWLIKDGALHYVDDRSVHEVKEPAQHDFKWTKTNLEDRRLGKYPHISILDKLFIEAINGDITFKIEDNTDTGKGIYSEPVENKDQQLDDADYYYADLGNIIAIKIKPYQENERAYVFNIKTKTVTPIPSLLEAGIVLPDSQGLIFSNGYYLQTGTYKLFESELSHLQFIRTILSPNGEDLLYVFYEVYNNTYVLMSYNVIRQEVETPVICNGFTVFPDGKLIYFRSSREAVRHHQVQIWQTPYTATLMENKAMAGNVLYKIGNKDIVHAMSEAQEILQLLQKEDSYEGLYEDIEKKATGILDAYFWIKDPETFQLSEPLSQIRNIAVTAIDEFAKVQEQRAHARHILEEAQQKAAALVIDIKNTKAESLDQLVHLLARLRQMHGALIDLQNVRYIDTAAIEALKAQLQEYNTSLSNDTVAFLLTDQALIPYESRVKDQKEKVAAVAKVIEGQAVENEIKEIASELELLVDILNSLKIEDTTQTTKIVEKISLIFAALNELKADLARRLKELKTAESVGSFYAQMTLLDQTLVNYMDLADTPEKCEDYFTKISVQVEELESRFADFDDFISKIADKRDEIIKAFNTRKEMLQTQLNRKAGSLEQIGLRVLKNIENKALRLENREAIFAFFAADLMIDKVRSLAAELRELGDVAKAENIETVLRTTQEEALRQLKDRSDLFVEGANVIALGEHKFLVNKQALSLSMIRRDHQLFYHLIGTSFYKAVQAETLYQYREVWEQELVSENVAVYRAEYLAYQALLESRLGQDFNGTDYINAQTEQDFAAGYLKGVHNIDAIKIYEALKALEARLGVLRFAPELRAAALFFWWQLSQAERGKLSRLIATAYAIQQNFPQRSQFDFIAKEIDGLYQTKVVLKSTVAPADIAFYIYAELATDAHFTASKQAFRLKQSFEQHLQQHKQQGAFKADLEQVDFDHFERFVIVQHWLMAFYESGTHELAPEYVEEAVLLYLLPEKDFKASTAEDTVIVTDLKGTHNVIVQQTYTLNYHGFKRKLNQFSTISVPAFRAFNEEKNNLVTAYQKALKISEFEPKVLSSFVRNKLINEVYFPLIGNNLAKQIGSAGDDKRTARMGMLLLVSPPGYGKTTLMEYLAKTMGLHFVKVNGPAIGHHITSIDPAEARTSGAREELKKINLALEMADNVMLYVDDIQHCSPEFLQKFISLADGQRKMEGIFEGESQTYDLRGKRFCVVMAGNPYTESGEAFKIPDMLANRSDVYNLGDVVGNTAHLFSLSLLENAIAENRYLQNIAAKSMSDFYQLVHYVEQGLDILPELESNASRQELDDAIAVLRHAIAVRNVVIQVNQQYIASAAMKDAYRVEPPFKMQGSYRNMNRMVSRLVPLMNAVEVETLVLSHYEQESQTLTSDAEANLLKVKSLMGILTEAEQERWEAIKAIFVKNNKLAGLGQADTNGQMMLQISQLSEHLEAIAMALSGRK